MYILCLAYNNGFVRQVNTEKGIEINVGLTLNATFSWVKHCQFCLPNLLLKRACTHLSSTVSLIIQPVSSKVRHFSTFFAHFGLTGYAPGTIAVNVTRLERGFNAYKTLRCIYPFVFNRFWDNSKLLFENCDIFIPHLCLAAPRGVTPSEFREDLDIHKTRMNRLLCSEKSMTICSALLIQYQRVTDRQTNGRTDVEPIAY